MKLLDRVVAKIRPNRDIANPLSREEMIAAVREKWREVPSDESHRMYSSDLLKLSDSELLKHWREHDQSTSSKEVRGWYRERYRAEVSGRRVLDLGCGFSVDGIYLLQQGAKVTFADIVEDNLEVVQRVLGLLGLSAELYFIDDLFNFHFHEDFHFIFAIGSLIHVPFSTAQREVAAVQRFLRPGGKFLFFGYPHERFLKLRARDGAEFGRLTDGDRTPWAEWYDDKKICELFGQDFDLTFSKNFGRTGIEFNWFELIKQQGASLKSSSPGVTQSS